MPREVNVYTSNWRATGNTVSVPQYELKVRFQWLDNDGAGYVGERTVRFPNVLQNLHAGYVGERMKEMLLDYVRLELGVDE